MDTFVTQEDIVKQTIEICESRGPTAALRRLYQLVPTERIAKSVYLRALSDAYGSASVGEKDRLRTAAKHLSCFGVDFPLDILFHLGLPSRGFGVKIDYLNGRLGDTLGQLAVDIHAMHALGLAVLVKTRLSKAKHILITAGDEFEEEFEFQDGNSGAIRKYLDNTGLAEPFRRDYLTSLSSSLFSRLASKSEVSLDDGTCVVHVRGGDALYEGALFLPPLSYYKKQIQESESERILIVAEPDLGVGRSSNIVPALLGEWCESLGKEYAIQSSLDVESDASALYYAKEVIGSNSSFSKWLPLYGTECKSLTLPSDRSGNDWVKDSCLTFIDCWERFNKEEWEKSMNYRLSWVSQH